VLVVVGFENDNDRSRSPSGMTKKRQRRCAVS
jgi:hypothetical protein